MGCMEGVEDWGIQRRMKGVARLVGKKQGTECFPRQERSAVSAASERASTLRTKRFPLNLATEFQWSGRC